ncbi:MAG: NADH-quinone oxidoreductase subunit NuoE [Thermodesulfobacteriota bacterium]
MPLPDDTRAEIERIKNEAENTRAALIPALWKVQQKLGWLAEESMSEVAEILDITPASVRNVATFYTMFFTKPVGRHTVWVCGTLSCALKGAGKVEEHICGKLGISKGETTGDGKITVMEAECLAACGSAPVMLVDNSLHENLTRESVDKILEELKKS